VERRKVHRKKRSKVIVTNARKASEVISTAAVGKISRDFLVVDAITRAAEQSGWPPKKAFILAMQMTLHGTAPQEAQRLFIDAERRIQ
jgi:hypothetical protein